MDLSRYQEHYSLSHRLKRYGWYIVNRTLFRLMVTNAMKVPRNLLLRLFGANIPLASLVYPSSNIWAPWNLSESVPMLLKLYTSYMETDSMVLFF